MEDRDNVLYNEKEKKEAEAAGKRMAATGIAAAVLIVVLAVAMLLIPDREFSEKENRMLAAFPDFSLDALTMGSFTSDVETYTADQFPLRDMWIGVRSACEKLLGHYSINGVFVCADDYLMEDVSVSGDEELKKRIDSLNCFAEAVGDVSVSTLIVPNAAAVLRDRMPKYAVTGNQYAWLDGLYAGLNEKISVIDVRDEFERKDAFGVQLYYRTDHHWTTDGAYEAFKCAAETLELDEWKVSFDSYTICDSFMGTLAAKTGLYGIQPDTIKAFVPHEGSEVTYLVENVETGEKTSSVFVPEKLESSDRYAVFFGGNYPILHITSTASSDRKLLVLKDSYANCFVPFLIPYYSEIFMVDARYCDEDIYSVIQENKINSVLFMYNASTFAEDSSIDGLLELPETVEQP